jgi:hypothetical protein
MNNKKLALAVIAVLLVAGLIGAGIMAWFTSEQAIVGNLFEAGTLVIELDEETPAEALMKFENMQPGDVEEATATIKNAGTLPFKFYAIITEDSHVPGNDGAGSEGGYLPDMLVVTVTMQGGKVYEAPLSALLNQVLVYADDDGDPVTVDPDETADINIKVVFNTAAGNEYQNAAFTGTITFIATQVDNPTEWQIFTFEKEKETAVEFSTQGVEMKVKAGDDTNTVITVERYDTSTNPPPSDMDPAGIYLDINADPPLPEGSEVVLEVSYAHLLPLPGGFPESALKLFHFNDTTGEWEDVTETVDTVNKKIISEPISSFSVFGIFYDKEAIVEAALAEVNNVPKTGEPYTFEEDIDAPFLSKPIEAGTTTTSLRSSQVMAIMFHVLQKNKDVLGLDYTGFDALSAEDKQMVIALMLDFKDGRHPVPHPEIEAGPFKSAEDLRVIFDWFVTAFSG